MKLLLKTALFALALFTLLPLLCANTGPQHPSPESAHVALAMEPASWLLVASGLLGGGFLRKRRLPGLNLISSFVARATPQSAVTNPAIRDEITPSPAPVRFTARRTVTFRPEMVRWGKIWASAAAVLLLLLTANTASADSLTFNSQAVTTLAFSPSSDSLSFSKDSGTVNPSQGAFVFQTGDFHIGDSEIPDQIVPFSFHDTLTLDGITQTLTIYGQDAVTQTRDTLTIFGGTPVLFGNETFTVQTFTLSEANMGDYPVYLQATVTPEPASLLLLGTGILVGAVFLTRRSSTHKA